jgi:hypothetical protein
VNKSVLLFLELDFEVSEFFLDPALEAWGEVVMLGVGFDLQYKITKLITVVYLNV